MSTYLYSGGFIKGTTATFGADTVTITKGSGIEPGQAFASSYYGDNAIVDTTAGLKLYNAGYLYGGNSAGGTASVGGIGLDLSASALVKNTGHIDGGHGNVLSTPNGGNGGEAVQLTGGNLDNYFSIVGGDGTYGGSGGIGVYVDGGEVFNLGTTTNANIQGGGTEGTVKNPGSTPGSYQYTGGTGGTGIVLKAGSVINGSTTEALSSSIGGGNALGNGTGSVGNGGTGVRMYANTTLKNYYNIAGGTGGDGAGTSGGAGVIAGLASDADAGQGITIDNNFHIGGNYGTASGGAGVYLAAGAQLTNNVGATISGGGTYAGQGGAGVDLAGAGASATNAGTISGGNDVLSTAIGAGAGANVTSGTTLTNSGLIRGGYGARATQPDGGVGVYLNGGTVTTSGRIYGGSNSFNDSLIANAVQFGPITGSTLNVDAGASFSGDVGGFRPGDTIDFQDVAYGTASVSDLGGQFSFSTSNSGTLTFSGAYFGEYFQQGEDSGGGTYLTVKAFSSTIANRTVPDGITLVNGPPLAPGQYSSVLTIQSSGGVLPAGDGATGIYSDAAGASMFNHGFIEGGPGAPGGVAGTGLHFAATATVNNDTGTIRGGNGYNYENSGGAGGVGVELTNGGILNNSAKYGGIEGGAASGSGHENGAAGGAAVTATDSTVINSGRIVGGTGGQSIVGIDQSGGPGGVGVYLQGSSTLSNSATGKIEGGYSGGYLAQIGSSGTLFETNGFGGAGVELGAGSTATVTNAGAILGGAGDFIAGAGGAGVYQQSGTLNNTGSITGGKYDGIGLQMTGGTANNNDGTITGGNHFNGGTAATGAVIGAGATLNEYAGGQILGGNNYQGGYGGIAVSLAAGGTLTSTGEGVNVITGGAGTVGGTAIDLASGATTNLVNGLITGGAGIYSVIYAGVLVDDPGQGRFYIAGSGGTGVEMGAGANLTFTAAIAGGNAAAASSGSPAGGVGGTGIDVSAGGYLYGNGHIAGGNGGAGYGGFRGGAGGIGVLAGGAVTEAYVVLTNRTYGGNAVDGGSGGVGVQLNAGSQLNNKGDVFGGYSVGGNGGTGVYVNHDSGGYNVNALDDFVTGGNANSVSGSAGTALVLQGDGSRFTNRGYLNAGINYNAYGGFGGNGAYVGAGADLTNYRLIFGGPGASDPGIGVYLNGGTVFNAGLISGGVETDAEGGNIGAAVQFGATTGGELVLESGWGLQGSVVGFKTGDTIDVQGITGLYAKGDGENVTLYNSDGSVLFNLLGNYHAAQFQFSPDSGNGTDVTIACFLRGTRIRAEHGEVAIENLRIGDEVVTVSGALRPIRWIGRRSYSAAYAADHLDVRPVLITQGALGDQLPRRDLRVSPEHAMCIDGVLIPAAALVNGHSILQLETDADIAYYHVEFDSHDVVYAEGAPSESFVDDHSRLQFDNAAEFWALYPQDRPQPALFCAPRVEDGELLETVRARLQSIARAGCLDASPGSGSESGHGCRAQQRCLPA